MRVRIAATLLLTCLAVLGCTQPAPTQPSLPKKEPGRYTYDLKVGEIDRKFILRVPTAYDASKPLPVVVLLHGWTGNANLIATYSGFADKAEKEGFFLVTPEGLGQLPGWNVGWIDLSTRKQDEVAFLSAVLDKVEAEVGVDKDRVFVAGHSNGAMLAHLAGSRLSHRIAAIGAVAGSIGLPAMNGGSPRVIPDPLGPVSVMLIHGKQDRVVAYDASSKATLRSIGALDSAKWWAERVGASTQPTTTKSSDGAVITDVFSGGRDGSEVVLVSLETGQHDWPNSRAGASATDLLWEFFKNHPKRR